MARPCGEFLAGLPAVFRVVSCRVFSWFLLFTSLFAISLIVSAPHFSLRFPPSILPFLASTLFVFLCQFHWYGRLCFMYVSYSCGLLTLGSTLFQIMFSWEGHNRSLWFAVSSSSALSSQVVPWPLSRTTHYRCSGSTTRSFRFVAILHPPSLWWGWFW